MLVEEQWHALEGAIVAAQGTASADTESLCRAFFKLADVDQDGVITQSEVAILKEVFDAIISILVLAAAGLVEGMPGELMSELKELYPAAFPAVAESVDDKSAVLLT